MPTRARDAAAVVTWLVVAAALAWVIAPLLAAPHGSGSATSSVVLDPVVLSMTPSSPRASLVVHNHGETAVTIGQMRFDGPRWDAFRIAVDPPPSIPSGGVTTLEVATSPDALRRVEGYDEAVASLKFRLGDAEHQLPVRFRAVVPAPHRHWWIGLPLGALVAFAARRQRGHRSTNPPLPYWPLVSAAFAAGALTPIGGSFCTGDLGSITDRLGPRQLAQCAAGWDGLALQAIATPSANIIAWLLGATTSLAIATVSDRAGTCVDSPRRIARAWLTIGAAGSSMWLTSQWSDSSPVLLMVVFVMLVYGTVAMRNGGGFAPLGTLLLCVTALTSIQSSAIATALLPLPAAALAIMRIVRTRSQRSGSVLLRLVAAGAVTSVAAVVASLQVTPPYLHATAQTIITWLAVAWSIVLVHELRTRDVEHAQSSARLHADTDAAR